MKTHKKLQMLKENNEDFEWYPTTNEILESIDKDLLYISEMNQTTKFRDKNSIKFHCCTNKIKYEYEYNNKTYKYRIESFIDIGAGDGRVLDYFYSKEKYGIEKAKTQHEDLIKKSIRLLGHDFYETVLIDRDFGVVFSNPPYSIYKDWCYKILDEVNASIFYLVIPDRYKLDDDFMRALKAKGYYDVIGEYNFSEGDREARAKTHLIRIISNNKDNTFNKWVENNIGKFKSNSKINLKEFDENSEVKKAIENRKSDLIHVLVENYDKELSELINTYNKLGNIDFSIIEQLGIKKQDVLIKIESDIKQLKSKFWNQTFNTLHEITSKLTYTKREDILQEIKWFKELDFNTSNIRTIIIWVIENYNRLQKEQMIKVYDDITSLEDVKPYKSNTKWVTDDWRYNKDVPTMYSLDYRIVVPTRISDYGSERFQNNKIYDLCVVAKSLGYEIQQMPTTEVAFALGVKHKIYSNKIKTKDKVLFEYKNYKNGNTHFKLNQEFLKTLNIEVGKLKGWIKAPVDIEREFDVSVEDSIKLFGETKLNVLNNKTMLLLN